MNNVTEIDEYNNTTCHNKTESLPNVTFLAMSYTTYKIGTFINNYYFPVFIPIGVIGNILSFLVMVQQRNRHMSMSLYLAAIAVADTIDLSLGFVSYLSYVHQVHFPPNFYWLCAAGGFVVIGSYYCSTLFILSMTFDRFYSIIRPHKASSFNTVKRAKVTIVCIVFCSFLYNVPHLFITSVDGRQCLPYGAAPGKVYWEIYYWLSFTSGNVIPVVLLFVMNSFIIHTLRFRSNSRDLRSRGQSQTKGQTSDRHVFTILLLVNFSFLILVTPSSIFTIFMMAVDVKSSPKLFADYILFYHVAHKMFYTNHGINFFLYVLSGHKFRTDLVYLFRTTRRKARESSHSLSQVTEAVNT